MKKITKLIVLGLFMAGLTLNAMPAFAKHDGGGSPKGFSHGDKKGWDDKSTPPGWSKGEKKGWNGEATPPGLSGKKENKKEKKSKKSDE